MRLQHIKEKWREVELSEINQANYLFLEWWLDELLDNMKSDGIVEVKEYIQIPYVISWDNFIATLRINFNVTSGSNISNNHKVIEWEYVWEYITDDRFIMKKTSDSLEWLYNKIYKEISKEDFKYNTHWRFNANNKIKWII